MTVINKPEIVIAQFIQHNTTVTFTKINHKGNNARVKYYTETYKPLLGKDAFTSYVTSLVFTGMKMGSFKLS